MFNKVHFTCDAVILAIDYRSIILGMGNVALTFCSEESFERGRCDRYRREPKNGALYIAMFSLIPIVKSRETASIPVRIEKSHELTPGVFALTVSLLDQDFEPVVAAELTSFDGLALDVDEKLKIWDPAGDVSEYVINVGYLQPPQTHAI